MRRLLAEGRGALINAGVEEVIAASRPRIRVVRINPGNRRGVQAES